MIYFTLQNFYENQKLNNIFLIIQDKFPDSFKVPVKFIYTAGSFPYTYWNGGINNNFGIGNNTYDTIIEYSNNNLLPLRINCSNINLNPNDFDDTIMNVILNLLNNSSNAIELSNLELYEYLYKKYPNFHYILSNNFDLINPLTPDLINKLNEICDFYFIQIPLNKIKDFDFLKAIKNKKNIELPIGDICNCSNLNNCNIQEQIAQYNYSDSFTKINCSKCSGLSSNLSIEDIQNNYAPLGFHNFILPDYCNSKNNNIIKFFINYFIKDSDKLLIYEFIEEQMCYD